MCRDSIKNFRSNGKTKRLTTENSQSVLCSEFMRWKMTGLRPTVPTDAVQASFQTI